MAALSAAYSSRQSTRREWSEQMSSLLLILPEQASRTLFSAHTVLDSFDDVIKQAHLEDEPSFSAFVSNEACYRLLVDKTDANPIIGPRSPSVARPRRRWPGSIPRLHPYRTAQAWPR
jgi:hypothetical protein